MSLQKFEMHLNLITHLFVYFIIFHWSGDLKKKILPQSWKAEGQTCPHKLPHEVSPCSLVSMTWAWCRAG